MAKKPADPVGELCELDPTTGRKTDARLWDGMLDGDTRNQIDIATPAGRAAMLRRYPKQTGRATRESNDCHKQGTK